MRSSKLLFGLIAALLLALPPGASAQNFTTGRLIAITGTGGQACASVNVLGMGTATWDITGAWSGTITFYTEGLGGTRSGINVATKDAPGTAVTTTTANGKWSGDVSGENVALACFTAYTSGTAYVSISASLGGGGGGGGASGGGDATAANQAAGNALLASVDSSLQTLLTRLGSDQTLDAAIGTTGPLSVCRGSTATPTAMSADNDATAVWCDLNGRIVVTGGVAHDAVNAGNPLGIGFRASSALSGLTLVADADRTWGMAGLDGVQVVRPHSNLEDRVSAVVGVTDGSSTSLVAAQGSGVRFCATALIVSNSSATNVTVDIRDGTAGSVIATIPAAANMGGAVIPLQTPLCTTANTAMAMDPSASATTVTVTAIGFKTKL